jgi:repressor LexA
MTIGQRIKALREQKGFSQIELAEKIGVSKQNLYKYENGIISNIPSDKIEAAAAALGTSPAYLMGWNDSTVLPLPLENIYMRPLYDSVAAGFNALAQNTVVGYIPTQIASPSEQEKYIWVNVVGDSMSPMIDDGSKVLIKLQESVDSGQIAILLIDDEEAVVKRVVYGDNWIELQSVNPYYPPRRFEGQDVRRVRVMGLVKEVSKTIQ